MPTVVNCNDSSCDVEGQGYTTESYQCTSLRALGLPKEKWLFWSESLDVL